MLLRAVLNRRPFREARRTHPRTALSRVGPHSTQPGVRWAPNPTRARPAGRPALDDDAIPEGAPVGERCGQALAKGTDLR